MDAWRNRRAVLRYLLAVLIVLIAVGIRYLLHPVFGDRFVFIPLLIGVTASTWLGLGPSLVVLLLATVAAAFLFLEPQHSLLIAGSADQLGFAVDAVAGLLIVVLAELTRRMARARGLQTMMTQLQREIAERRQAETQLQTLAETLEVRVRERTAVAEQRAEQLRALAARLTEAEEQERRRLAQVLHDHLQQLLVAARLKTAALRHPRDPQQVAKTAAEVETLLGECIDESRSLTVELSPPVLYTAGLVRALEWLAQYTREKHGLAVEVRVEPDSEPPAQETQALLFQAVRELIFNAVKHARATRVAVVVAATDGQHRIEVDDDGVGFDPARVTEGNANSCGFGLFSVRERLGLIGGRLEIEAAVPHGTRAILLVPRRERRPLRPDRAPAAAQPITSDPAA